MGHAWRATANGTFDNEFDLQRGQLEDHHQSTFVTLKNDATLDLSPRQSAEVRRDRETRAGAVRRGRHRPSFRSRSSSSAHRRARCGDRFTCGRAAVSSTPTSPIACAISDSVVVEAGLRAGSESYTPDGVHVSPRLNVAWTPSPRTSVRAAWGLFHQPQAIHELQVEDGVTEYQPAQRSEHRVLGIEHSFRRGIDARLELYDKTLTHLRPRYVNLYDHLLIFPELRADRIRIAPESGHARGAELLVRSDAAQPLSGWISYTLARVTDRTDRRPRRAARLGSAARHDLQRELSARSEMELQPRRHVAQRLADHARARATSEGTQLLTELGPRASTRLPDYQRLDFRASRTAGAFSFFVELFNVLGHENVTRVNTFEFQQDATGAVTASPVTESVIGVLPSFGVTWRF